MKGLVETFSRNSKGDMFQFLWFQNFAFRTNNSFVVNDGLDSLIITSIYCVHPRSGGLNVLATIRFATSDHWYDAKCGVILYDSA